MIKLSVSMPAFTKPVSSGLMAAAAILVCLLVMNLSPWPTTTHEAYVETISTRSMTYRRPFISKHIWNVQSRVDWKPCEWWTAKPLIGFPQKSTGFIKVDCYGGLNQMRRDLCDGVDIARLLNATLVLPDFEAASYWNDTRHPFFAKAARCHVCFKALRLVPAIQKLGAELLQKIPQPILSLHMRFEPDMIAYSRCQYNDLSHSSVDAINSARNGRTIISGDDAVAWRKRGKCPLTPKETAFILQALGIPTNTTVYLAAGESLLESEDFTSIYRNSYTKSSLLDKTSLMSMRGNSRAALDYYVSINSEAYIGTYFGNMDKMVAAMRALSGQSKTLFLNRKAFAEAILQGLEGEKLAEYLWETHTKALVDGRGSALPDCFCMSNLTNSS